jgi:ketosteroid isomerase-like protein
MPSTSTEPVATDERDVLRAIRAFIRTFENFDVEAMVAAWDDKAEQIVYQPEERAAPMFSIAEVREYARTLPDFFVKATDVSLIDKKVLVMGGATAHVYIRLSCSIELTSGRHINGQLRQSFMLTKRDETWRLVHYHESRQSDFD